MKTNRMIRYKWDALSYADNHLKAYWGIPSNPNFLFPDVVAHWTEVAKDPMCMRANISDAFEAGYRKCIEDQKNGVNGQERMPVQVSDTTTQQANAKED